MTKSGETHLAGLLWGRLVAEGAVSLSDQEIERIFRDCASSSLCIPKAKEFRDRGLYVVRDGDVQLVDGVGGNASWLDDHQPHQIPLIDAEA